MNVKGREDVVETYHSRTELLLGAEAMAKLAAARVAIFGIGGVGGYVAEALARVGVGGLDLVDHDVVTPSNLNRQIIATVDAIGRRKVEVAKERLASVAPDCDVAAYPVFYLPETAVDFDFSRYDYVVDAVDTVAAKMSLIEKAKAAGTPIISAMGAGNKLDPTAFQVADIYDTAVCPLARVIRAACRKAGVESLKVVYSEEPPRKPSVATAGKSVPGSVSFVPAAMGLIIGGEVVKDIIALKS